LSGDVLDLTHEVRRQRVHVDLEADRERRLRTDACADAAVRCAGDRLVQLERVAPERFVAERLEAERVAPFFDRAAGLILHGIGDRRRRCVGAAATIATALSRSGITTTDDRECDRGHC
jgi:hypothetical protein